MCGDVNVYDIQRERGRAEREREREREREHMLARNCRR